MVNDILKRIERMEKDIKQIKDYINDKFSITSEIIETTKDKNGNRVYGKRQKFKSQVLK